MSYRLLLDFSHPDAPDSSHLPDRWSDVTDEYPGLSAADEVKVFEFEGGVEDFGIARDVLNTPPEQSAASMLLLSTDPPPWLLPDRLTPTPQPEPTSSGGATTGAIATDRTTTGASDGRLSPDAVGATMERTLIERLEHSEDEAARYFIKRLLKIRLRARKAEVAQAKADLQVRQAEAGYERERVAYLRETISGVRERVEHMREWRRIAKWGVGFFVATTIFAMWAGWYLITGPVKDGKMTGETLSLVLFVLALFALSPASLLLLERPLKGLDSWAPGGKAADDEPAATDRTAEERRDAPADAATNGKAEADQPAKA